MINFGATRRQPHARGMAPVVDLVATGRLDTDGNGGARSIVATCPNSSFAPHGLTCAPDTSSVRTRRTTSVRFGRRARHECPGRFIWHRQNRLANCRTMQRQKLQD